ncbi:MAG: LysM peptidoglycan-binding domain-containing protein [Micrococcales bacterium]
MATAVATQASGYTLSRKARLIRTAVLLALVITGINQFGQWQSAQASNQTGSSAASFSYVTVRAGETLWQLAVKYAPTQDPRDWITKVVSLNNLQTADLVPGQKLAVPAN